MTERSQAEKNEDNQILYGLLALVAVGIIATVIILNSLHLPLPHSPLSPFHDQQATEPSASATTSQPPKTVVAKPTKKPTPKPSLSVGPGGIDRVNPANTVPGSTAVVPRVTQPAIGPTRAIPTPTLSASPVVTHRPPVIPPIISINPTKPGITISIPPLLRGVHASLGLNLAPSILPSLGLNLGH